MAPLKVTLYIRIVTPEGSDKYQQIADSMSKHLGVPRGRLDVVLF